MPEDFYTQWLGIQPGKRPPDHYEILGLDRFCHDRDQIDNAANEQLEILDQHAYSNDTDERDACERMIVHVAKARTILVDADKRAIYDSGLADLSVVSSPAPESQTVVPPAIPVAAAPVVSPPAEDVTMELGQGGESQRGLGLRASLLVGAGMVAVVLVVLICMYDWFGGSEGAEPAASKAGSSEKPKVLVSDKKEDMSLPDTGVEGPEIEPRLQKVFKSKTQLLVP